MHPCPAKTPSFPIPRSSIRFTFETFTHTTDELPEGRRKLIHAYGSVVKVVLQVANPKYAGIFRSGGSGIARLSIARLASATSAFTPAMAVKFLVDGSASVNLHVMNSVDGQGTDTFFFSRAFSNILPEPSGLAGKLISVSFGWAVDLLNHCMGGNGPEGAGNLPLLQACQFESGGKAVAPEPCPHQLIFRPVGTVLAGEHPEADFREGLAKIPSGTRLYSVVAKSGTSDAEDQVGYLTTQSDFVASAYGDEKLFFAHLSKRK